VTEEINAKANYMELVMTQKFLVLLSGVILLWFSLYKSFAFDKVHKRENCLISWFWNFE
jgi:hypothetical protein